MIDEGVTTALVARDATRNDDDSHTSGTGAKRPVQVACECTYPNFLKCQPLNFKGTEGVIGLTQWFKKMEFVYSISNCTVACQRTLKKMMTDKYYPRGEIKKREFEMWNLKVKHTDVVTYNQRFQELALMCDRMFPEEIDKVEKYVDGLPDMIHGSLDGHARNNRISNDLTVSNALEVLLPLECDRNPYEGLKHIVFQMSPPNVNTGANQRACFECGAQGHFKKDCPKLKNNNRVVNQVEMLQGQAKVYAVGNVRANPDNNVITDWAVSLNTNKRFANFGALPGYYRRFIEEVKMLCSAPILALHDGSEDFIAYCDASKKGLGAVLMQREKEMLLLMLDAVRNEIHLRVRALVMTIGLDLPKQILRAQTEARKPENIKKEDVGIYWESDPYGYNGKECNINEVVTKHGIPVSIICDRDPRFASNFWRSLQKALGTSLDMSKAYYRKPYGKAE
ncbi:putative reverse transcriptase domain-containing protein [Tanacetum coccineum]